MGLCCLEDAMISGNLVKASLILGFWKFCNLFQYDDDRISVKVEIKVDMGSYDRCAVELGRLNDT